MLGIFNFSKTNECLCYIHLNFQNLMSVLQLMLSLSNFQNLMRVYDVKPNTTKHRK